MNLIRQCRKKSSLGYFSLNILILVAVFVEWFIGVPYNVWSDLTNAFSERKKKQWDDYKIIMLDTNSKFNWIIFCFDWIINPRACFINQVLFRVES